MSKWLKMAGLIDGQEALEEMPQERANLATLAHLKAQFIQRSINIESEGQSRERAVWIAAFEVFTTQDERRDLFEGHRLKSGYRAASLAIGDSVVVTFHDNGKVSFHKLQPNKGNNLGQV